MFAGGCSLRSGVRWHLESIYVACSCIDFDKILARVKTIQTKLNDR